PVNGKKGEGVEKILKKDFEKRLAQPQGKMLMAQEFVDLAREFRVYVVGKKAVGGMEKVSDSWLHNVSRGAKPARADLPKEVEEAAIKASLAVQTEVAGVDVGVTKKGLFVLEVNRSPGFKGYESLGIDFAKKVIEYLEQKAGRH
ncbi:MAG: ATP-grasp domain-containing protein, partial [archaeon]|nr:ATP-grasp domain-containing protein [archaeon]